MNKTIRFHIPEHTMIVVHSPVRTWNVRPVHLHHWRFTAVEACQFVEHIHKVQIMLCFQNHLRVKGKKGCRSQMLTSQYLHNKLTSCQIRCINYRLRLSPNRSDLSVSLHWSRKVNPFPVLSGRLQHHKFISCRRCVAIYFHRSWVFCR
jgi:hypothetical protein